MFYNSVKMALSHDGANFIHIVKRACLSIDVSCLSTMFRFSIRVSNTEKTFYSLCGIFFYRRVCLCDLEMEVSMILIWLGKSQPTTTVRWINQILWFSGVNLGKQPSVKWQR